MALRPIGNPPNPWHSSHVEWIDAPPTANLEIYEEKAKTVLSENQSPDIGFRFSLNPYRGCQHACSYCLSGDTAILLVDGTTRRLDALRKGDRIFGTERRGHDRRYVETTVLAHWQTVKPGYRIRLEDGTELVASGDHRFLTPRGWKHVTGSDQGAHRRAHLTTNDDLVGFGLAVDSLPLPTGGGRLPPAFALALRRSQWKHRRGEGAPRPSANAGQALKSEAKLRVVSVEALGVDLPLFDITTGTGDFIANGVVSHNCYARPTHQYWDFGAGTDFDRKIVVKVNAPEVMEAQMMKPSWKGELVMFSGNTDCYQPLEASYGLTRRCLEVAAKFRNPIGIITKGAIIRRDIDVLQDLARNARVRVNFSVAFADDAMARKMEPGAPSPTVRLKAMRALADAGIPVGVGVAPIIPGLNDSQVATILAKARDAGATRAFRVMLRLPLEVKPVFLGRLQEEYPDRASKVENAVRDVRGGALYRSSFGERGVGQGPRWDAIESLFDLTCKKLGLNAVDEKHVGSAGEEPDAKEDEARPVTFRRPGDQLKLF